LGYTLCMLHVTLSPPAHDAVQALRRDPTLTPHERDWVEMILLSAAGWSPPRIASHLRCHPETVRRLLKRVQHAGLAALRARRTGPPPDTARRQQVTAALDGLLAQDRTWTARQLAAALTEQGIRLSTRQTRRYLSGMRARWRRTARTLKHKQDPVRAAQAARTLAVFKKKPRPVSCAWSSSMSVASRPASR
jgi:transposase